MDYTKITNIEKALAKNTFMSTDLTYLISFYEARLDSAKLTLMSKGDYGPQYRAGKLAVRIENILTQIKQI